MDKFRKECEYVNGATISGVYSLDNRMLSCEMKALLTFEDYQQLLDVSDAVFIYSNPQYHYQQALQALRNKKHVLCEAPLALTVEQWKKLKAEADSQHVVLRHQSLRSCHLHKRCSTQVSR